MKNLVLPLLLLFVFTFTACSTDDEDITVAAIQETEVAADNHRVAIGPLPGSDTCLRSLEGYTIIDVSNGLGSPIVVFHAITVGANRVGGYSFNLQVQPLDDCEDFDSTSTPVINFNLPGLITNSDVDEATIALDPADLPWQCYKWRFAVSAPASPKFPNGCVTYSQWYEAPLF
jgi:hypothetical protein